MADRILRPIAPLLLVLTVLWGCEGSPTGPEADAPLRVGTVAVQGEPAPSGPPTARETVHRAEREPVVLESTRAEGLDAYFKVRPERDAVVDLVLHDALAPEDAAPRLRQTQTADGTALRFTPGTPATVHVEYVSMGRVVAAPSQAVPDSTVLGTSDEPAESVHYYRDGDDIFIVYDFTADDPATVTTPEGQSVERCTEIRLRLDDTALTLGRPALAIEGTGWDTVRLDDGADRIAATRAADVRR